MIFHTLFLGSLINANSVQNENRKSRQYADQVYDKERYDKLLDWNTQNEYNSPEAQMQRYEDAGLNPSLMYGQGNSGNAESVQPTKQQSAQFNAPQIDPMAFINGIYDLKIKKGQADNLKAQNLDILKNTAYTVSKTKNQDHDNWYNQFKRNAVSNVRGTPSQYFKDFYKNELEILEGQNKGLINDNAMKNISLGVQKSLQKTPWAKGNPFGGLLNALLINSLK